VVSIADRHDDNHADIATAPNKVVIPVQSQRHVHPNSYLPLSLRDQKPNASSNAPSKTASATCTFHLANIFSSRVQHVKQSMHATRRPDRPLSTSHTTHEVPSSRSRQFPCCFAALLLCNKRSAHSETSGNHSDQSAVIPEPCSPWGKTGEHLLYIGGCSGRFVAQDQQCLLVMPVWSLPKTTC
jgi:hypothetical protein